MLPASGRTDGRVPKGTDTHVAARYAARTPHDVDDVAVPFGRNEYPRQGGTGGNRQSRVIVCCVRTRVTVDIANPASGRAPGRPRDGG
jgi:hypothetical protein